MELAKRPDSSAAHGLPPVRQQHCRADDRRRRLSHRLPFRGHLAQPDVQYVIVFDRPAANRRLPAATSRSGSRWSTRWPIPPLLATAQKLQWTDNLLTSPCRCTRQVGALGGVRVGLASHRKPDAAQRGSLARSPRTWIGQPMQHRWTLGLLILGRCWAWSSSSGSSGESSRRSRSLGPDHGDDKPGQFVAAARGVVAYRRNRRPDARVFNECARAWPSMIGTSGAWPIPIP